MKLTQADIQFSKCVRERANWICEYPSCGAISEEGRATCGDRTMQCSHFLSRKYKITRYHPDNCLCLCATHHELVENNPFLHNKIFTQVMGDGMAEMITELKNDALYKPLGGWKTFEKEAAKHYRKQLKKMRDMRLDGKLGRIEFDGYQ
tara:strand:+ start:5971 stop:6417 length:447 start_codon:yes stop_codon:yes gene_type:complete